MGPLEFFISDEHSHGPSEKTVAVNYLLCSIVSVESHSPFYVVHALYLDYLTTMDAGSDL